MLQPSPLISVEALRRELPQVCVVDCSHDLGDTEAGARLYTQDGHIPGAVHAHLDRDLSGAKTGHNGRHPLPQVADLVQWLGSQGIAFGSPVVGYDRSGGMYAARLWWLLRWLGHHQVRVLDGGWQAWQATGAERSLTPPQNAAVRYVAPSSDDRLWVDVNFVERNLQTQEALMVDARGPDRYAGTVEPMDPRAGHIPGAVNRPFTANLGSDGRFKSAAVLAEEWSVVLGDFQGERVIAQCGSGVTACHNLLALELAGVKGARLYPGSWSEWCSDIKRPVATDDVRDS
ncbi:MAG: sulfurtransferase [Burkholderiaceae bacterium]|nr:sulfurtransferase [Burkholderiaceae bacterium]